jgi:L-arabinose isomerase
VLNLAESEVWFVTGSQHLYGPETLEQVAAHSAQIAAALDDAPAMAWLCCATVSNVCGP